MFGTRPVQPTHQPPLLDSSKKQPNLADDHGVERASRTARRVVLLAYAATAVLVGALTVERLAFHDASSQRVENVRQAVKLADAILLEDERLTMSANLAAATGDPKWVQRYDERLPEMDKAIAAATAMAPASAAQRFDLATRQANDNLVALERQAFEHVAAGRLKAAQATLSSSTYASHKQVLVQGTDAFMDELQATVDGNLQALTHRSWALIGALLCGAALGFVLLWRRLNVALVRADTAFKAQQAEVSRLALHDSLTGLPNRRYLGLQLEGSIARAQRKQLGFAVLMIDLDGFKPINDQHGHSAGDQALVAVADRLRALVRKGEVVARLGGDEFVVVVQRSDLHVAAAAAAAANNLASNPAADTAARTAQRLSAALSQPIQLAQAAVQLGASVGVALYPGDGISTDELLRKADLAMYRAKHEGRGVTRFFAELDAVKASDNNSHNETSTASNAGHQATHASTPQPGAAAAAAQAAITVAAER
jgi:diguanylate cyclase (GGDEF)-like protein